MEMQKEIVPSANPNANANASAAKGMKVVYTITERSGRSFWTRIGAAFTNRDGSLNVRLDATPVNGQLQIREWEPRDDMLARAPRDSGNGARARADDTILAELPF